MPAKLFLLYIISSLLSSPGRLKKRDFGTLLPFLRKILPEKSAPSQWDGAQISQTKYFYPWYSSRRPELSSAGRSAIYSTTAAAVLMTALMTQAAAFQARVRSAAGLPKISSL